jgi:hypothetical protein
MTDTPKFTVVNRRKFLDEDDGSVVAEALPKQEPKAVESTPAAKPQAESAAGKRLTLVEAPQHPSEPDSSAGSGPADLLNEAEEDYEAGLPPAPSAEESSFQKAAYDQSSDRLDDLVRAQNPGAPAPEKVGFEHLVQQLYLSAMMQMGAGTPEGQRPRIDIIGARQTIDLLGVLLEKSKGNLSAQEERTLQTVLFELRMTFLELTRMISTQQPPPVPPGGAQR